MNQPANFDNTLSAILTLFEMSTTEGWVGVMWNGVDAPLEVGEGPSIDASLGFIFFFLFFMIVSSQFFINLFVCQVTNTFNREKEI